MKTHALVLLGLFCAFGTVSAAPKTLAEQMEIDNPRVVTFLAKLKESDVGKRVKGVKLSDGSVELKGSEFLGSKHIAAKKQHIYLFRDEDGVRAYAWVDTGGKALSIPVDKSGSSGENASILSGDIYTYPLVEAGDGLVILWGATPEWLAKVK
jgi:hypothetical protein